jgi:hypothetical protein
MTEQEMQDYFPKVYPKIFSGNYGGIAINAGWFQLLDSACRLMQSHLDWKPDVPQVTADQVKEKFGTLRFYYTGGDDYCSGVAAMAEHLSGLVCEECGAPGTTGGSGWVSTLCETHRSEREARRRQHMKADGLEE